MFDSYGFTWTLYKQRKCKTCSVQSVQRVLSLKFVKHLLPDWSTSILHIHDDYCCPEVLVCHFEMFAVGERCVLFPSTREANSHFEEEMATTFGDGQSVDTHFGKISV